MIRRLLWLLGAFYALLLFGEGEDQCGYLIIRYPENDFGRGARRANRRSNEFKIHGYTPDYEYEDFEHPQFPVSESSRGVMHKSSSNEETTMPQVQRVLVTCGELSEDRVMDCVDITTTTTTNTLRPEKFEEIVQVTPLPAEEFQLKQAPVTQNAEKLDESDTETVQPLTWEGNSNEIQNTPETLAPVRSPDMVLLVKLPPDLSGIPLLAMIDPTCEKPTLTLKNSIPQHGADTTLTYELLEGPMSHQISEETTPPSYYQEEETAPMPHYEILEESRSNGQGSVDESVSTGYYQIEETTPMSDYQILEETTMYNWEEEVAEPSIFEEESTFSPPPEEVCQRNEARHLSIGVQAKEPPACLTEDVYYKILSSRYPLGGTYLSAKSYMKKYLPLAFMEHFKLPERDSYRTFKRDIRKGHMRAQEDIIEGFNQILPSLNY